MKTLEDDEYAELVAKARAWDAHIRRRLQGNNEVAADLDIFCKSGDAEIELKNHVAASPYGDIPLDCHPPYPKLFRIRTNDMVRVNHIIKLTVN